jgi:hypothetical protein
MLAILRLIVLVPFFLASIGSRAEAIELAPAVLVDRPAARVYSADPQGQARASRLADGETLWRSVERAWPLALADGRLLALGHTGQPGEIEVLLLDPASGAITGRARETLPAEVLAEPLPMAELSFRAHVERTGEGLELHWWQQRTPLRGAPRMEAQGGDGLTISTGVLALDLEGGTLRLAPLTEARWRDRPLLHAAPPERRIAGGDGAQYLSADGLALMRSEPRSDARLGIVNRLEFHDAEGRRLGALDSLYAALPFVVIDDLVLYRAEPMEIEQPGEGLYQRGAALVAYDPASGLERWSAPLPPRHFLGVMPP